MNFVLDNSVTMRWSAYVASYLELSMRLGLPLATLDQDLQKAAKKTGVKRFS